jgi:ABC-type transport system involved in cytochrome bd biosynthesis fused ATPase/permease subunit
VAGWSALALAVQGTTAVVVAALATAGVARGQLDAVWPPVLALVALAAFEPVKPLVTAARQAVAGRGSLHRLAALLSTPPEPLTAHERPVSTTRPAPPNEATPPAGARVAVPGEAAPPNQATRPAGARVAGQSEAPNAAEAASERVVPTTGTWEVRDVVVRYRADGPAALAGVSVTLAPGRAVAVVGVSGSGKSTLLGVLARLVPVRAGRVLLAGVDVLATPADLVRERVTGVLPDAHVFAASLRANLLLAAPDADDDRLLAALRAAGLDEPPGGWDAVPGEDGARLSGGQRQRVLLARALLADRPLVLLDEPTEGLDPAMADEVLARVRAACRGRALCVVTHRLAPLAGFDEVVVLDAGRVVQRGTHAELVARPGRYRDLWEAERLANP